MNRVLSDIYMLHFPINLCGVEDSVENYQSYLYHVVQLWCSNPMKSFFFRFVIRISISLMIFMLKYAFILILFTGHTSFGCRKSLVGRLFDRKPYKLLQRTHYRICVAAHVILKVHKEDVMDDALFAPLSNYRERASKLTGISIKTLSHIKAELEKVVLAPWKPWSGIMELSDFDKCERCINCKITDNKQYNKLYIIKKIFEFGFRTTISSLLFKKI